jgi:hypothetical protein
MDLNQLLAQQQAALNQMTQNAQRIAYGAIAIYLALFIITCLVIYAFYARLRDISTELRKFRIAYEFAHTPHLSSTPRRDPRSGSTWPEAPKPLNPFSEDAKYRPKE